MRTMYDDIIAQNPPPGAPLYAGYDDGNWPDAEQLAQRFPDAKIIRITVFPADNEGDCLDVEKGDASPSDLPGWLQRRRQSGASFLWAYVNQLNNWGACLSACQAAGHFPDAWWVANWDNDPTIPPGALAKQYQSYQNYDISSVVDFIPGFDAPHPSPPTGGNPYVNLTPYNLNILTDVNGDGYSAIPNVPAAQVVSVAFNGAVPETSGKYVPPGTWDKDDVNGNAQINIYNHSVHNGQVLVTVWVAS